MAEAQASKVFLFDNDEPEMRAAYRKARDTFRYFCREVAWERRRIVPALDLACVKTPFSDDRRTSRNDDEPDVEQMWLDEVDFDGRTVTGVLLNSPNWLKTVKAGDAAHRTLAEITDWMYAVDGEVYGAFTVNLMRARMSPRERKDHDKAWGLDFGDPTRVRLVPRKKDWFSQDGAETQEHPMSMAMAPSLEEELRKRPTMVRDADDRGWTLLHHTALAGSTAPVRVLLEAGADPNAKTGDGRTPLQLAESLGWTRVVALLKGKGAK
jgi:uncharacterized protein YegJ (DUF2314 family)